MCRIVYKSLYASGSFLRGTQIIKAFADFVGQKLMSATVGSPQWIKSEKML